MKKITADIPVCEGEANALRRSKQLALLRWTPIRPIPAGIPAGTKERRFFDIFLPAWCPQTGAGYSAARYAEKYIGFNVSIETYMTALANPDSVMYTRSLHGRMPLSSAYYGTVCSQFVSYVLDFPFQIDCHQLPFVDGMEAVDATLLENLRLCDVLLDRTRHVSIITGIERDEDGDVVNITVTESTLPTVKSTTFTPNEFIGYWLNNGYEVFRYCKLDKVTYIPDPWIHLNGDPDMPVPIVNPVIMADYGNKANYLLGEKIILSVFDSKYTEVELYLEEHWMQRLPVRDGHVVLELNEPGFYRAVAVGTERYSEPTSFCVVEASALSDKVCCKPQETITMSFSCAASDPLVGWVVKTAQFAKYWCYVAQENGVIPMETNLPAGDYLMFGMYRNEYGVYSSHPCSVHVSE